VRERAPRREVGSYPAAVRELLTPRCGSPPYCRREVRVAFAEEWVARRERRPLIDVGARVYFMDRNTGRDI
jgi:hypothetical protein